MRQYITNMLELKFQINVIIITIEEWIPKVGHKTKTPVTIQ